MIASESIPSSRLYRGRSSLFLYSNRLNLTDSSEKPNGN